MQQANVWIGLMESELSISNGIWHSGCRVHNQWHLLWEWDMYHEWKSAWRGFAASASGLGFLPDRQAFSEIDSAIQGLGNWQSSSHRMFCFSYRDQPFKKILSLRMLPAIMISYSSRSRGGTEVHPFQHPSWAAFFDANWFEPGLVQSRWILFGYSCYLNFLSVFWLETFWLWVTMFFQDPICSRGVQIGKIT